MKDYKKTASEILKHVGGEKNVSHLEHCSTRLRFSLVDSKKANIDALKATPGVMGVVMTAQCQVIIGNDVVEVYDAIMAMAHFDGAAAPAKGEKQSPGAVFMDYLIGIFQPLVPAIAGAGILKALLSVCTLFGWMDAKGVTYTVLYNAGDAALYFLPLLVAVSAATKLKANRLVALAAVGALIMPNITALLTTEGGATLFGLPLQNITYTYQVFPAILSVLFLTLVERLVTRISPKPIRVFFVPMVCFVVVVPVTLLFLGPLGYNVGQGLTTIILALYNTLGWLAVAILAGILPLMIATGMHKALLPYAVSSITEMGMELLYMPASLAHNISESGACFAVAVRTKDTNTRSTAISAGISALFGITEPALYGITLQNKRALAGVVVGSVIGGLTVGLVGLRAFVAMGPGLAGMAMWVDPADNMNFVWGCVGLVVSLAASFVATLFLYQDKNSATQAGNTAVSAASAPAVAGSGDLVSPLTGTVVPLNEVKDEVFSTGILGDGVAVRPTVGELRAPADGVIQTVTDTGHAIGMVTDGGAELLMHIGMDTVKLEGKGFEVKVQPDQHVKAGELLVTFDLNAIQAAGYDVTTPVVVTNSGDFTLTPVASGAVRPGDVLLRLSAN